MTTTILRVAVPSPLRRLFDYLPPKESAAAPEPGMRVRVPFGRRRVVGLVTEVTDQTDIPAEKLKPADALLDSQPLLPADLMSLLEWAAAYYHHAPGDVFAAALPVLLRQGHTGEVRGVRRYRLTAEADPESGSKRAPKQAAILACLARAGTGVTEGELSEHLENWRPVMKRLLEKGQVEMEEGPCLEAADVVDEDRPELNTPQREAVTSICDVLDRFEPILLDGVTGSGKTEVYLNAIDAVLKAGRQALVLVPEIGLTPQLVERFRRRYPLPVAVLHSGMSDTERLCAWQMARSGQAPLVIGTRSAIFTPLARPGLIVVDEEHDASFKQQDGFRYSARDLAVRRAQQAGIPVVLGSATPSLESWHNAEAERYRRLLLPERAGSASHPSLRLVDIRHQRLDEGISPTLLEAMKTHLTRGGQTLLFLNRRGFAPVLLCHDCGWVSHCPRCDAHMTLYGNDRRLRCHHCATEKPVPAHCPDCGSVDLRPVGEGTERIEQALQALLPEQRTVRIDRDSTRRKNAMDDLLAQVHSGEARILVGTQMLAKGHHFPDVTLVGILNVDQGLFSADFRATERMAQLITQVAGRAGRAEKAGEVLIQTHHPEHPLLRRLVEEDYRAFANEALAERRVVEWPPFGHLALLRAEGVDAAAPMAFLEEAAGKALGAGIGQVELLGPVPAPMERRAGRFRAQLMLQARERPALHALLRSWVPELEALKSGRRVRWSLDVDPAETF